MQPTARFSGGTAAFERGRIPSTVPDAKLVAKIERCRGRRESRVPRRERTSSAPRPSGVRGRTRSTMSTTGLPSCLRCSCLHKRLQLRKCPTPGAVHSQNKLGPARPRPIALPAAQRPAAAPKRRAQRGQLRDGMLPAPSEKETKHNEGMHLAPNFGGALNARKKPQSEGSSQPAEPEGSGRSKTIR